MKPPPEILLGDLARAVARLEPRDAATRATIASLLGLEHRAAEASGASAFPSRSRGFGSSRPTRRESAPPVEETPAVADLHEFPLLPQIAPRAVSAEVPWRNAPPLPPVSDRHLNRRLPYEPLFEPRWTRELLVATIATDVPGDQLDLDVIVRQIASGRALEALPLLSRRSASVGVQLLIDGGAGMEPFRRDCAALLEDLRRVAGRSRVHTLHFEVSWREGVGTEPWTSRIPYAEPEAGMPVLAVSDLGLAERRPVVDDWIELGLRLARRGSELVVLVPYPSSHWPDRLARAVKVVQWDRATTVAAVDRA